ncbi:MAG TPA: peptidoglycan editing factor PgeF [Clostridiales bacterium]|nr:peptidoglycan editing factor PgeF [Clostridiales bacterium]
MYEAAGRISQNVSGTEGFQEQKAGGLVYYTIPAFTQTGLVRHGFSSRLGGVSSGECSSLNLSFHRKDSPENVRENFRLFCSALDIRPEQMVFTHQVHKNRVMAVDETHEGMGWDKASEIRETDGLVTNRSGLALVTFYADCVPLFFLDPVRHVIGLSQAGWRGTASNIARQTLEAMGEHYGTQPGDCLAAIGPSIGSCCFEVDGPVAEAFAAACPDRKEEIIRPRGKDKYDIDLWAVNRYQLQECGVPGENITLAALCTGCNVDVFFSHRREKGRTGSLAALLMLI